MRKRVLIIDDDLAFCQIHSEVLQNEGFEVVTELTGATGLQSAAITKPDLILLDIELPDIDGFLVLATLKEQNVPTRVVIITGKLWNIGDIVKYIKAGACDFCQKGTDFVQKLPHIVRRNLTLETTLNYHVSNPAPLMNKIIEKTDELLVERNNLLLEVTELHSKLSHRPLLVKTTVNLILLLVATGVALLINSLTAISGVWIVLVIFFGYFFLRFPIENISKLYLRDKEREVKFDLEPSDKTGKLLLK